MSDWLAASRVEVHPQIIKANVFGYRLYACRPTGCKSEQVCMMRPYGMEAPMRSSWLPKRSCTIFEMLFCLFFLYLLIKRFNHRIDFIFMFMIFLWIKLDIYNFWRFIYIVFSNTCLDNPTLVVFDLNVIIQTTKQKTTHERARLLTYKSSYYPAAIHHTIRD